MKILAATLALALCGCAQTNERPDGPASDAALASVDEVGPVPEPLRAAKALDPFYVKHVEVAGFPILGSARVSDEALLEAAWILRHVLEGREDVLGALAANGVHLVVMAYSEYTTDLPEQRGMEPRVYWDRRARGLGGSPVSCAEENLLGFPGDPYSTENILIHEFAHIVHGSALRTLDPTFDRRLKAAYESALERGLWAGTYAATDRAEYWAEAVQDWFDDNRENDSLHNHVNTRAELREYDPALAALCEEVLGDRAWRYEKPAKRDAAGRAHLAGLDLDHLPTFRWRDEPILDRAHVQIDTALGKIVLELDHEHAPRTTANFLYYVHQGFYSDGSFFRALRTGDQSEAPAKVSLLEARADPKRELLPPIPLERTSSTGLRHLDGTVSMMRGTTPDSARDRFFVCIGDQPELDFGGESFDDGQGCAVFGRVIAGLDLVRKMHAETVDGQNLDPPVPIQRAVRLD